MPNANPSGPNQPMNQHPRSGIYQHLVGVDLTLMDNLQAGEHLLIPAPPKGGVRAMMDVFAGIFLFIEGPGSDLDFLQVYLKDTQGRKYLILDVPGPIPLPPAPGASAPVVASLFPTVYDDGTFFTGLYLNFTGGQGGRISVRTNVFDVRNPVPFQAEVTESARNVALPVPEGNVHMLSTQFAVPVSAISLWNFDSVEHNVSITLKRDGFTSPIDSAVDVVTIPPSPSPNSALFEVALGGNTPGDSTGVFLTPGSQLRVQTLEPIVSAPVILVGAVTPTNRSAVRQDQGGAY